MAEISSEQAASVPQPASARKHRGMWWMPFALIAALVIGLGGGVLLDRQVFAAFTPAANLPQDTGPEFRLMAEAWNTIEGHYVDRSALDPQRLGYGAQPIQPVGRFGAAARDRGVADAQRLYT